MTNLVVIKGKWGS